MIRNVIFDWSGTLVDDLPAVWEATNHVFERAGVKPMSLSQFRSEFRLPFSGFYERYTPGLDKAQLESWFHAKYREAQASITVLRDALPFLEFCRAHKLRTLVLSTLHAEHFERQSRQAGLDGYLEKCYLGVIDKREKIHGVLSENGLVAEETLFVGDMEHDIETAKHGGVLSCAVLTGYQTLPELRSARPDLIVEHLGELRELLVRSAFRINPGEARADRQPLLTVGGLVFDSAGRVLMVQTQKWSHLWGMPGGKVRYGETLEDALRREVLEETALEVKDVRFVMLQECIDSPEFYRQAHFALANYTCRSTGEAVVRLNEEGIDFRWVTPQEALGMKLNSPTRRLLISVTEAKSEREP